MCPSMDVKIEDIIKERYLQPSGITEQDVFDTALHEDVKKIISLDHDLQA
jgi:hypothetical protein